MHVSGSSPIPWALVGFGSGGRIFHAPLLACAAGLRLAVVVTTDATRRAQVAESLPGVGCVDDLAAAAASGVAGVTISTPPATHEALALEAIRLGLHMVVDKPFALDLAGTRRIADAAATAGVQVFPYFNRRRDDDFLTVRALVRSGELGAIRRFESRLDRSRPVKPGWPSDPARGGGLLLDLGPHLVDQALGLLGPAKSVAARLDTVRDGAVSEDCVMLDLSHESGATSLLSASLAAPAVGPRFLVQGSAGGVRIEGFDGQEAQLKAGGSPGAMGDAWGVDVGRVARVYADDGSVRAQPLERGRWDAFYPAVAAAILGTGVAPTGPGDAIAVARVLDAARSAAREGRRIDLRGDAAGPESVTVGAEARHAD
jgi:predicted dehydrogenase